MLGQSFSAHILVWTGSRGFKLIDKQSETCRVGFPACQGRLRNALIGFHRGVNHHRTICRPLWNTVLHVTGILYLTDNPDQPFTKPLI